MSTAARTKFHLLSIALLSFLYCGCIHASEAQATDGLSAATRRLYPDRAFRIGLIELSDTQKVKGLVARSVKELRKAFFPYQIEIQQYASRDLEQAIKSKSVDAFIASSGFYWRMIPLGARDVATMISRTSPDPNHTSAITFITSRENTSISTLADMQGKRLSASYPTAFMGYRIGLAEIASRGYDPEKFFFFRQLFQCAWDRSYCAESPQRAG